MRLQQCQHYLVLNLAFLLESIQNIKRPSRRKGATRHDSLLVRPIFVSIPTLPEGRVLLLGESANAVFQLVSIPTLPEGRVLPRRRRTAPPASMCFNPHPSRRKGAKAFIGRWITCHTSFNPHPSLRKGATHIWLGVTAENQFQSSPFPKEGCYPDIIDFIENEIPFQSPPFPKEGRYRQLRFNCPTYSRFQSPPFPEEGCYHRRRPQADRGVGFNPHPSRRKGATDLHLDRRIPSTVSIPTYLKGMVLYFNFKDQINLSISKSSKDGPLRQLIFQLHIVVAKFPRRFIRAFESDLNFI